MEIANPLDKVTPSKKTLGTAWKIFLWMLGFAGIAFVIYWVVFLRNISWATVKQLIAQESAKYADKDKVNVEFVLLQGAKEIMANPFENKQARSFASAYNLPIERVIVDSAIKEALDHNFIPTLQTPSK